MEPDPVLVQNLVEMGFPEDRVKRVLKHFRNNFDMAMDHLINAPPDAMLGEDNANEA